MAQLTRKSAAKASRRIGLVRSLAYRTAAAVPAGGLYMRTGFWLRLCDPLRLEELLFSSIADVAVLSVDVNVATARVDVRCTSAGAWGPGCGAWAAQVHGTYMRFPLMSRVRDEESYSSCGSAGSPAGTPIADASRSSSRCPT